MVRERVKPARDLDSVYADNWWRLWRPRPEFRAAAANLKRYIVGTRVAKRILFTWCDPLWLASDSTNVIALDTDYAMGILTSRIHTEWAAKKSSTLRVDIRYTPTTAFDTFPWPQSSPELRDRIADRAIHLFKLRSTLCQEHGIGLTRLYNAVDEGAFTALRDAHAALDLEVVTAYGWGSSMLEDIRARNRELLQLNAAILAGAVPYTPF